MCVTLFALSKRREHTRVYAKEIVESPPRMTENGEVVDFETHYAPGIVFKLTENDRWQFADAKDFLTKFSRCIVCGRHLKAAASVAAAIGPVCAKYFAHSAPKPIVTVTAPSKDPRIPMRIETVPVATACNNKLSDLVAKFYSNE